MAREDREKLEKETLEHSAYMRRFYRVLGLSTIALVSLIWLARWLGWLS